MDIVDGDGNVTGIGEVDIYVPGTYMITFNHTDDAGNAAIPVTRTIEVVDTTRPVIERLGEENMSIFVWEEYIEPWVKAFDIVDGNLSSEVIRSGEVDAAQPGLYELVYQVSDSHGNEALSVFRTVEVINRAPVSLSLSGNEVKENLPAGTVIGEFSTEDLDDSDGVKSYTYELVAGESTSEELFILESNGVLKVGKPLDFEEQTEHQLRVRVVDEFGGLYENTFTVDVVDVFVPMVDTLGIEELDDGGYQVGGILVDDGGILDALTFGVLVSDRPIVSREQDGVEDFTLQINGESLEFGRYYGPDPSWKRLYVRAYAWNEEGISYGLEERINLNPVAKTVDQWSGATAMAEVPGWWESEWFGIYFKSRESGWILHENLGWVYPSPSIGEGLWMWKKGLGWMWTDEGLFPYLYAQETGSWLYFFGDFNQQRLLFDYGLGRWKRLDEVGVDESGGAR